MVVLFATQTTANLLLLGKPEILYLRELRFSREYANSTVRKTVGPAGVTRGSWWMEALTLSLYNPTKFTTVWPE